MSEGLDISQPFRRGRADDEWLALRPKHLDAVADLDALPGLDVLGLAQTHAKVDSLIVELFHRSAWEWLSNEYPSPKEQMDAPPPDACDECLRTTFISLGYDNSGGDSVPGFCIACGYERDGDDAFEMYMDQQWARWNAA